MASRTRRRLTPRSTLAKLPPRHRAASPCWARPEEQRAPEEKGERPPSDPAPTATRWVPSDDQPLLVTVYAKNGQTVVDADPEAVPAMVRETTQRTGNRPFWATIYQEVQADADGTPLPHADARLNDVYGFDVPVRTQAPAFWVRAVREAEQRDRTTDKPLAVRRRTLCLEEFVESRRADDHPQVPAAFAGSIREAARRDPSCLWDRPLKAWKRELDDWWFRRRLVEEGTLELLTPDQLVWCV